MLNEVKSRFSGKTYSITLNILTLTLGVFFSNSYSQVTQEWVARYNEGLGALNTPDIANSITVDGSGNVYVTGRSQQQRIRITGNDYTTIKYNSAGVQQWLQIYDGGDYDEAYSIAVDGSGNVYVTGRTGDFGDYATIKYNSSGVQQWVSIYYGPGGENDEAYSIAVDGSGNVYVTGYSFGSISSWDGTFSDYATIKYNTSGVQQWVARYNGPGNDDDRAYSLAVDGLGNVYVTGRSVGIGTNYDYATIKYNSSGVQQWFQRYNGPGNDDDRAYSLVVDGSGNVYVTGTSYGNGTDSDYATIKYNSSGVQQWVQRYNGPGNSSDGAYLLAVDGSGNVYVTGGSYGVLFDDYATIKYNSSGVQQWVQRYHGPGIGDDGATSIAVDGSGNVYVTGQSVGIGTNYDYATIKYNTNGVQQWVQRYNGPGNSGDVASSLAVDGSHNVYVTGYSFGIGTDYDYATIKYSQPAPISAAPSNLEAAADSTQRINLSWMDNSNDERGFGIERSTDDGNTWRLLVSLPENTVSHLDTGLTPYSVYHYRVYAFNPSGNSPYSNVAYDTARTFDPKEDIFVLISKVNSLRNAGILNQGQANSLIAKLNAAREKIIQRQNSAAINLLNAFNNQVNAFIDNEILTQEQGQPMIDIANDIINQLSGASPFTGLSKYSAEMPREYALHTNFPNPFNPKTVLSFQLPIFSYVRLIIYDVLGRETATLVNEELTAGTYKVDWDASNYPGGVYFYRITAGNFTDVKKMVVVK